MQTIYTITSPNPSGQVCRCANIIAKNWYLFKVYSDNISLIKRYIQYINGMFDNAFDALNIEVTSYDIPDNVMFDSGYMSDYINAQYGLSNDDIFTFEMHLIVESEYNEVLGKTIEVMTNDFGYDDPTSCYSVFKVLTPTLVSTVLGLSKYLLNKEDANLLRGLMASVWDIMRNDDGSDFLFRVPASELYESPLIHNAYLRILQLKYFICYFIPGSNNEWLASYGAGKDVDYGYLCD